MAITYLSGGRIQGSSTADPVRFMNIDSLATQGTNYRVSLDLQDKGGETVDTDDWVIRFKRVVTGGSDGIGSNTSFAMTNTDYTTLPTSTSGGGQRVMGFKDSDGDGGAIARSDYNMFPAPDEWSPETHIDFTAVPITQYFEIIRSGLTGTGTLTCNVYTASDYSGTPATGAKSADSMVVRYFSIGNYSDSVNTGGLEAKITDFNFYNGWDGAGSVPTPTYTATFESGEWGENNANFIGVSATYTDEKTTITDVPAGTRYEETDTRKIFRSALPLSLTGLKAYYTLDEASGDMINTASAIGSTDAISNFDLSVTGATRDATGKIDKALSFASNNIAQADDSNLADTNFISQTDAEWTICCWVKLDSTSGNKCVISTTDFTSGQAGFLIRIIPNGGINIQCGHQPNHTATTASSATITNTNWNFLAVRWSDVTGDAGVVVNSTVESVLDNVDLSNTATPSDKLLIGNMPALDNDFLGTIDELSIWNRILTTAEIAKIYNSGSGKLLSGGWVEKGTA